MVSQLLDMPGEIRNQIYHYALDMDDPQVVAWPSYPEPATRQASLRMSLLITCKKIYLEAASLLRMTSVAHIRFAPEQVHIQRCLAPECFGYTHRQPPNPDQGSTCPNRATAYLGLSRFMKVDIVLPGDFTLPGEMKKFCHERLLEALTILTDSSAEMCEVSSLRRQVRLHMTETINPTKWSSEELPLSGAAKDIIEKDAHTDWQFHYHIHPCKYVNSWSATLHNVYKIHANLKQDCANIGLVDSKLILYLYEQVERSSARRSSVIREIISESQGPTNSTIAN